MKEWPRRADDGIFEALRAERETWDRLVVALWAEKKTREREWALVVAERRLGGSCPVWTERMPSLVSSLLLLLPNNKPIVWNWSNAVHVVSSHPRVVLWKGGENDDGDGV